VFKAMLQQGADPHISKTGSIDLLTKAMYHQNIEVVELLLERGLKPNFTSTIARQFIAHLIYENQVELIDKLFGLGFKPDTWLVDEKAGLLLACEQGSVPVVKLFIKHGANTTEVALHKTSQGIKVYEQLIRNGRFAIVRMLMGGESSRVELQHDMDNMYLPCLVYWKDRIFQIIESMNNNSNMNNLTVIFIIQAIIKVIDEWSDASINMIEDIQDGHPHLADLEEPPEISLPASGATPQDLDWAICCLDATKGWVVRTIFSLKQVSAQSSGNIVPTHDETNVVATLSKGIMLVGGPGNSAGNPLIVKYSPDHVSGIMAEHEFLHNHIGEVQEVKLAGPHFEHEGHLIDQMFVRMQDGSEQLYFFDITEYYGRYTEEQLEEIKRTGSSNSIIQKAWQNPAYRSQ
jgi:hypothetical protein